MAGGSCNENLKTDFRSAKCLFGGPCLYLSCILCIQLHKICHFQPTEAARHRCSEIMQHIYKRAPKHKKCNFKKVALQLWHGYPVNLLQILRTPYPKTIYGGLLLNQLPNGSQ